MLRLNMWRSARAKLRVLLEQRSDLSAAIDQLLDEIAAGRKIHEGL